jgi:hypothetical protein
MSDSKIRGYLGEQSFEIIDGQGIVDQYCEVMIFSAAYGHERKAGVGAYTARQSALEAVMEYRLTRQP